MDKRLLIISALLLILIGCSKPKFEPSSCGFNNEKTTVSKIYCNNFWINSKGIELSISGSCTAVKASDCHSISFSKLKVSGTCNEEINIINGPIKICTTGLTSGQQAELNLQLSYSENGEQKIINGKLRGKVE